MALKLGHLQNVVKNAQAEEKATNLLRNEARRAMGPIIDTDVRLDRLAEEINDRLDVLERTGRNVTFKTSIVAKFVNHKNPELRKMAARLLPENLITRFVNDRNRSVRLAVAQRMPSNVVKEMMKKFPTDEELRLIYSKKRTTLKEAGVPTPKIDDEEFDIYGKEPLGDVGKSEVDALALSDTWYDTIARRLYQDYGGASMLDLNWEERAVNAYCDHNRVTNGSAIDKKKLFDALQKLIDAHDDYMMSVRDVNLRDTYLSEQYHVIARHDGTFAIEDHLGNEVESGYGSEEDALNASDQMEDELSSHYDDMEMYDLPANDWKSLGELADSLDRRALLEETKHAPETDSVTSLVHGGFSRSEFINKATVLFSIKESLLPAGIRKFVIGENISTTSVPAKGVLPTGQLRAVDEFALDKFCEAWTERQAIQGEPLRLNWYPHPMEISSVGFEVKLK